MINLDDIFKIVNTIQSGLDQLKEVVFILEHLFMFLKHLGVSRKSIFRDSHFRSHSEYKIVTISKVVQVMIFLCLLCLNENQK